MKGMRGKIKCNSTTVNNKLQKYGTCNIHNIAPVNFTKKPLQINNKM